MLTIKKSKIYSDKKPEELISRLNWKTYHVNKVLFAETNNSDTNKPLTGKVDEKLTCFAYYNPKVYFNANTGAVVVNPTEKWLGRLLKDFFTSLL